MHHRRRMTLAPLGKAARFAVEVPEKNCHAHGNVLDRETTTLRVPGRAQTIGHIRVNDENRGLVAPRLTKLRSISDIHQALALRFLRNVAIQRGRFQIAMKKCKDVRVMILDGLSA